MKAKLLWFIGLLVLAILYYLFPVYGFYAHKGKLPMLPWGELSLPLDSPQQSYVYEEYYRDLENIGPQKLEQHRLHIQSPGISIAVAIDGQLVWNAASGWADINEQRAMTVDSQVRIGSTSKALTSAGLARLVQKGKISLDTKLSELYPSLPNPRWAKITPRQLASHMAGIAHYPQNTDYWGLVKMVKLDSYYDNVHEAIGLFDQSQLLFAPGDKFEYSSLGTVLLSGAMAKAAEMPYKQWMQQQVFSPLNLRATHTESEAKTTGKLASFYWRNKSQPERLRKWRRVDLSHRLAGGGWISTSKDLAVFGQGFMQEHFITAEIRKAFWTPQQLNDGQTNGQNYAIGWRKHKLDLKQGRGQVEYLNHGGVSRGAQSFLMLIPEHRFSLAVNINSNTENFSDFAKIAGQISRLFIQRKLELQQAGDVTR